MEWKDEFFERGFGLKEIKKKLKVRLMIDHAFLYVFLEIRVIF